MDSISAQTYSPLQLVFVADHSEELHQRVLSYARSMAVDAKILLHSGDLAGANVCRNVGIRAADGHIIGLIDDDAVLFPNWVEETVRIHSVRASMMALTGPAHPLWDEPAVMSWFPRELYFVWGCTVWEWNEERPIRNVGGMNCSFKRDALIAAGLYRPDIGPMAGEERIRWFHPSGEEIELSLRLRHLFQSLDCVLYSPKVQIFHRVQRDRFNAGFVLKRCFRFGYTRNFISQYTRQLGVELNEPVLHLEREHFKIIVRRILSHSKSFVREPVTTFRLLLTLVAGVIAVAVGYCAYPLKPYDLSRDDLSPKPKRQFGGTSL